MANLISSKQISGVVTASAVSGDFQVSGSSNFTGSLNVSGSISASGNISGSSFFGDGSTLSGVELAGRGVFSGSEQLPGGLISSSEQLPVGIVSGAAQLLSTFDTRYLNTDGDGVVSGSFLSVGGLGVVSGSSQVSFTGLDNLPAGLVSGSIQVLGSSGILSSSEQLPAGIISSSAQLHSDLDSRYATDLGEGIVSGSVLRPGGDGVISGSSQVNYNDLDNLPSGIVSGAIQILGGTDILSGSRTNIDNLNVFTSSIQTEVDGLSAATSSYLTSLTSGIISSSEQLPGDLISGSAQITSLGFVSSSGDTIPAGTISGSAQITELGFVSESGGENSSLNAYTASTSIRLTNIESTTSSLEQRVGQIESNTGSYDDQTVISSLNSYTSSTDTRLDGFNTYTSSTDQRLERIEFTSSSLETRVDDLASATASINTFTGSVFISSSAQITALGFVSESSGASVGHLNNFTASTEIQLTNLESFTSSVEGTNAFTQSLLGTNEFTSSTTNRLNNLEVTTSSFENKFGSVESTTSSFQSRFETIESTTSSFQSRFGTIETETASIDARLDNIEGATSSYETIGRSIVSGSSQLTSSYDERYEARASATKTLLSASIQVDYEQLNNLPDNIVSSSEQLPGGLVSSSVQILGGTGIFSGSEQLEDLGFRSGSLITGEVSDIELEMSGSGSFKRKALTDSYQNLEFISTPLFQTGSSNWTISDGTFVRITTSGTYLLNSNFTLFKANDNDRVALFKWQRSLNNTDWTDVSGSTFGIGSPSQEPDYAYGGGVSTTFFESGSYVRIVGKIDASSEEPIALHNSDSEGGRSTVSMFLINGTNAGGGGGGSTDLGSLSPAAIDVSSDSIGFVDSSAGNASRRESIVDLVNAIAGTGMAPAAGQLNAVGPAGTISGSEQITGLGFISSSDSTTSLNTFTSSIQTEVDGLSAATSSYLTGLGSGVVSGSKQITDFGFISSSDSTTSLNTYTSSANIRLTNLESTTSSLDQRADRLEAFTGSVLISSSAQITALGFVSESGGENTSLNAFTSSANVQLSNLEAFTGSVLISSSAQITALGFVSESGDSTPAGTISGSEQITDLGFISSSDSTTSLNTFTSSIQTEVDALSAATSSYLTSSGSVDFTDITSVPSGILSGSEQITGLGFISSSDSTTSLNTYTSSANIRLSNLESTTSSLDQRLDSIESESGSYISNSDTASMTVNSASIAEYTSEWKLTAEGSNHYVFQGPGFTGSASDPNIYLVRGQKYKFTNNMGAHPFRIQTTPNGASGTEYNNGVTNNNVSNGTLIFDVPMEAPDVLYYQCTSHGNMGGAIFVSHVSGSSGGSTDITSLNSYTASNDINITNIHSTTASLNTFQSSATIRLNNMESTTSSFDGRLDNIEAATGSYISGLDSGIVSGAGQIGALGYISGSQVSSSISFDGNRTVSNTDLPSGVYNNNFGTSGSIQNFLEAVFFPNTSPVINSVSFSIDEFEDTDSIIGTVSATDAEGQTITFATQSGYSADKFTINSSTGVITARARTTSSINTDTSVFAGGAHPFLIKATDTFSGTTNKTIHIRVTPNTAPKFREGSAGGTIITSVAASFNENSSNNALVKRVYFTDDETDSITITSSSIDNEHFDITVYSNYFDIRQNTGSLDYEVQSLYTFAVTASDEHFLSASQGTVGQTILPVSVSVTDNVHPTINNQTLSSISENSSNGAVVATISATDNEGDTITFSDFTLYKLELDDANVSSASYGGTSHTDPTNNAFQCSSTGQVTRKNGVYINSDLINEYQYTVRIRDSYNTASNEAIITIPISDDTPPTVSDNWSTPYVIESAVSGASVYVNSNGRSGTIAAFSANQSVNWTMNSGSGVFDIDSSGRLSIKTNLSGSTTSSGDLLSGSTIATNTFGTTKETPFTASVAANQAPSISFTNQSAKFETNLALNGVCMVSMSVSDDESDTPFSASLSGSDLELVYSNANSSSIGLHLTDNASAREYFYSVTITDQFGKSQTYSDRSFTVTTSADYGKTYVYRSDYGSDSGLSSNYSAVMGISTTNGATPPEVTAFTANDTSPMRLISSSLGDASLSLAGGATATRVAILSGSNLDTILSASTFSMGGGANQYIVIVPSGSDMIGVPTSMTDSFGGSTAGEYVMAINGDGSGWGAESSIVHLLDTSGSINGYDKHFVIGRKGHNAANSVLLRIIASSGSLPS